MNPMIGITTGNNSDGDYFLRRKYCTAILRAGGIPIMLPPISRPRSALGICDGILLSGGGDIAPRLCGIEEYDPAFLFEASPERDEYELELTRLAFSRDIPILGICRGIQVLNAALGGSLHFHILNHTQKLSREQPSHTIHIAENSYLNELFSVDTLEVNSFHHQAIRTSANGLRITAVSEDGIAEAAEGVGKRFCIGVQWHPEHMNTRESDILFAALCAKASQGKK